MMKFGLDLGLDLNYMRMDDQTNNSDYEGPTGYLGADPVEESSDMAFLLV